MLTRQDIVTILNLFDELCIGAELTINRDTSSGTDWGNGDRVINSEDFRSNIQRKLKEIKQDIEWSVASNKH